MRVQQRQQPVAFSMRLTENYLLVPADDETPRLVCGLCQHNWCRKCKVAWHEGKTCDEHQREVEPQRDTCINQSAQSCTRLNCWTRALQLALAFVVGQGPCSALMQS